MFYDQFISLCNRDSVKPTPLIRKLGFSAGNIKRWENGATVNSDILLAVSEHFKVSIDYLLTGKEKNSSTNILNADEQELLEYFNKLSDKSKGKIIERAAVLAELENPVANEPAVEEKPKERRLTINCSTYRVSAGAGFELGEGDKWYEIEVSDTPEAREADFALKIKRNSMEPIYFDGDIVLVKKQPSVDLGEIGIFNVEGNGFIKKFGGDRLISLNAEYGDIVFSDYDEERIQCFGKVIGRV